MNGGLYKMLTFFKTIFGWLGGGALDRVLDTVDQKVKSETDRTRLKSQIVMEHLRTRPDFMRAGGFWLMLLFALPMALWSGSVAVYSVLWCQGCAYPQDWTIAALPSPLDEGWSYMVVSIFGVIGLTGLRK